MDFPNVISELIDDEAVWENRTALRIYKVLLRRPMIYYEPEAVKLVGLAGEVKAKKSTVIAGLRLLIERGYVIECGRGQHGVRELMLARTRTKSVVPASVAKLPVPQIGPNKKHHVIR